MGGLRMKLKNLLSLLLIATMMFAVVGCGTDQETGTADQSDTSEPADTSKSADTSEPATLSGSINAGGSTSVEEAALAALQEFTALNPDVTYEYDATGSSTGMTNAIDGTYSLGFASRNLKDAEIEAGLVSEAIAMDGIAVAVNPGNTVTELTVAQVQAIYKGEITNWSELGGEDGNIVVVSREDGSGTRGAFEEIVEFEDALTANAVIKNGNGEVATYVSTEENAIGYISFTTLKANQGSVVGLIIEGTEATVENVQSGAYPIARPFMMAYMEGNLNEAEKAFIEFLFSTEGQDAIEEAGAIRIN
jgi:phosphate transport system substrate-binding protein